MYELTVNGIKYENVVYNDKGFIVQETGTRYSGKYNNKYRIQNTYGTDENHTHLHSLDKCKEVIALVIHNRLPRGSKKYVMKSCFRLSIDEDYRDKVQALIETKRNKGQQSYRNKRVGANGHCYKLYA
jgi:hypothetical protein